MNYKSLFVYNSDLSDPLFFHSDLLPQGGHLFKANAIVQDNVLDINPLCAALSYPIWLMI